MGPPPNSAPYTQPALITAAQRERLAQQEQRANSVTDSDVSEIHARLELAKPRPIAEPLQPTQAPSR